MSDDTPRAPAVSPTLARRRPILDEGTLVAGAYRVRQLVGEGAMGQVFEAFDVHLARRVAIKVLWPEQLASLRREAQVLAALGRTSVPAVHALVTHEGVEMMVMELVLGHTLRARIEASPDGLPPAEGTALLAKIAAAIGAVHEAGVTHRDVKPDNVLVGAGERIVLTDFGLVRPQIDGARGVSIAGTPMYMAPELLAPTPDAALLPQADAYAFGVTAFEVLTGSVPYDAPHVVALADLHANAPIPRLDARGKASGALADLVASLLAKEPHERPASLTLVARELERLAASTSTRTAPAHDGAQTVLVVDDDRDLARLLSLYVKQAAPAARVTIAHRARDAIKAIEQRPPDLLVVDLSMPEMSGVELCMYLRGEGLAPECRVIAVSAGAEDSDVALLRTLGVRDFVAKGADLRAILQGLVRESLAAAPH